MAHKGMFQILFQEQLILDDKTPRPEMGYVEQSILP